MRYKKKTAQAAIIIYGVSIKEKMIAIPRKTSDKNEKIQKMARHTSLLMRSCFWMFISTIRSLQ